MKQEITLDWQGKMQFQAHVGNHSITLDGSPEVGGEDAGARPKPLMLVALAGCSGMDVVSLLKKMRVNYDSLEIKVEGNLTEGVPAYYDAMHVIYLFTGSNLPMDKIEKAVKMSMDTYCGVAQVYKKALPVTYEIQVKEQ